MLKHISLAALAFGLLFSTGCEWPWSKKIEPTAETRAQYIASVDELMALRAKAEVEANLARKTLDARDEEAFRKAIDTLRQNFERQVEVMRTAEDNASTKELRAKISAERDRTQFDLDQLGEYEKLWRNQIEMNKWRAIDWR